MDRFSSILIVNRGEIACRVMRTAHALGYRTIAVYSEADSNAPHVKAADEAVCIGPAPVGESYLRADKILQAANQTGAGAIHPGYGFLSENAGFADACVKAGITFIGPDANAITLMGNKAEAKRGMIAAGVPCVPGYEGEDQSDAAMIAAAENIGYPLMVKAAAGGGGRGMRLVENAGDLTNALALARSEAENAFGSGELILEKAIQRPRHVEVQVFADEQGNTIHLGERDCSVQRRHQKVVEEAPCPVMTDTLRAEMGAAAVAAAKSINYRGAGTVEFLLDESGAFYFLEMNTRLQVEHPVTECITGLDLVALQIQVAQGKPLGIAQEDVLLTGHAIEVRLYAEDPAQDFLPMTGPIDLWDVPAMPGLRVDSGIETGGAVSPFYDPMLAKIIAYGETRDRVRRRLIEGLRETHLFGTRTNRRFLIDCLEAETFAKGAATTAFIAETFGETLKETTPPLADAAMAAVLQQHLAFQAAQAQAVSAPSALQNWANTTALVSRAAYIFGEQAFDLVITAESASSYRVTCGESGLGVALRSSDGAVAYLDVEGVQHKVRFQQRDEAALYLDVDGRAHLFENSLLHIIGAGERAGGNLILSPMHGALLELRVAEGDEVTQGQCVAILEAMKMQHEILVPADGTVIAVRAAVGAQVPADEVLIELELTPQP
ncbi:MAG: acetyl-CoA carboxylase biotin carboxylase subunit [Alphaproteobacteria bacterium]